MSGGRMKESSGDTQVTDGDARWWPQGAEGALPRAFVPAQQQLTKKDVGRGQGWQLGEERLFWHEEFWQGVEGAVLARP